MAFEGSECVGTGLPDQRGRCRVKAYIYHVMAEAKKKGLSMILISDELPELLGMSDRLLVMKDGRITGEFTRGENFTQEALIEVMV